MTELEEALECFERDINLGLSGTKVMAGILAVAYRTQEARIRFIEDAWNDFRFRLISTYGGPSPYLKIQEMDQAIQKAVEKAGRI